MWVYCIYMVSCSIYIVYIYTIYIYILCSYTLLFGKPPFETSDVKTTYRRIKMNAYSFPEHVSVSDAGKGIITRILNLDPSKRSTLDEVLEHPFFHMGNSIPKQLPASTLACPPSATYVRQFMPNNLSGSTKPNFRPESTAPVNPGGVKGKGGRDLGGTQGSGRVIAGVKPGSQGGQVGYRKQPNEASKKEEEKKPGGTAKCILYI